MASKGGREKIEAGVLPAPVISTPPTRTRRPRPKKAGIHEVRPKARKHIAVQGNKLKY
ncbi:hypothetical protein ACU4GR_04685 [Methylobacterium oryzae CBMB20]